MTLLLTSASHAAGKRPPPLPGKLPASAAPPTAATSHYLGGVAFAAGRTVPEILRHLELALAQAQDDGNQALIRELETRSLLLHGLRSPDGAATLRRLCAPAGADRKDCFAYWLTRLLAAWYANAPAVALEAVPAAGALAGARTSTGDLMLFHVFAISALARWDAAARVDTLERHCAALDDLEGRCQLSGGAMGALAQAACAGRRGDAPAAMRGYERASCGAARLGLHWLAALAYEQAALQASKVGMASAAGHYREKLQSHYRSWGALGHLHGIGAIECSIAHELNQPLAAIALHAAAAGKWLRRAEPDVGRALDALALIGVAGRQAGDIVRGLQRLADSLPPETTGVAVDDAVRETVLLLDHRLREHDIRIELALGLAGCAIDANRVQLQQVLTNLVVNALEAHLAQGQAKGRRIRIETRPHGMGEIELAVSDNGPGIADTDRGRLFKGLFSTRSLSTEAVKGMGLTICRSIVRAHGGDIWFEPCAAQGACFRVRLPLAAARARQH